MKVPIQFYLGFENMQIIRVRWRLNNLDEVTEVHSLFE